MEKIIKETIYDIKGTTKLKIGDPCYFEEMASGSTNKYLKKITFDGNISAAPMGKLRIRQLHCKENKYEYDFINVTVVQGKDQTQLNTYLDGRYYPDKVKGMYDLGCDTAQFEITTKYGYDLFYTGADGYYGNLIVNKQYYGMFLTINLDMGMFSFDEVENRMLRLFPKGIN